MGHNDPLGVDANLQLVEAIRNLFAEALQAIQDGLNVWGNRIEERLLNLETRMAAFESVLTSFLSERGRGRENSTGEFPAQGPSTTTVSTSSFDTRQLAFWNAFAMYCASTSTSTFTTSTTPWVVPIPSTSYFIPQTSCISQAVNYITTSATISSCMPSHSDTSSSNSSAIPHSRAIVSPTVFIPGATGVPPMNSVLRKALGKELYNAARKGRVEEVRRLLEAGAGVNYRIRKESGFTPLHIAALGGHLDVMSLLINAGADVNMLSQERKTPLHLAAFRGKVNAIEILFTADANANIQDETGCTPLHDAVLWEDVTPTRALIIFGADVNLQTNLGITPLHRAVLENKEETVMQLIFAGASLSIRNNEGEYALHWAAQYDNVALVRALAENTPQNVQTNEGNTPLHYAVRNGSLAAVDELISAGEHVDVQNADGESPLHWAARGGNEAVVQSLIGAGANKELRDKSGKIPFDYAVNEATVDALRP